MRIVLAAVALLAVPSAHAQWDRVAESRDAVYYVDPATIRTDGSLRRVQEIQDYAEPRRDGTRSRRMTFEFDCGAERWRVLSIAEHPAPMAGGAPLRSWQGESDWSYLAPVTGTNITANPLNRTILRYVCSR